MKPATIACLVGTILISRIGAQTPALKEGVSVEMPVASHAIEMRAADGQNAVVITITAEGGVYAGAEPTELAALNRVSARTVYVKADARAQYQAVFAVLDALHGKSVVLLSAAPETTRKRGYGSPYGTRLTVSQ